MDSHILSFDLRALVKAINRYLGDTMPESARNAVATGGNARIIMFLNRNRDKDIYQHTIEEKFCITRSTASRVLALMEKKGLVARVPVEHDARCKKIVLTSKADSIVSDLKASGERMESVLLDGFSSEERAAAEDYVRRMRANIERAQDEFQKQRDRTSHLEAELMSILPGDAAGRIVGQDDDRADEPRGGESGSKNESESKDSKESKKEGQ